MGLRSFYGSGPDEEEIFRLTNPDCHPNTEDTAIAEEEVHRLSAAEYDDLQEQFDEQESSSSVVLELIEIVHTLSPEKIAELLNFLHHEE